MKITPKSPASGIFEFMFEFDLSLFLIRRTFAEKRTTTSHSDVFYAFRLL